MVRKLLSPRWILIHVGVGSLIFLMVNLGFWQLNRLNQKRDFNSVLSAHSSTPVQSLDKAVPGKWDKTTSEWIRVSVTGSYDSSKAITIINRSQDGTAGYNSVVPFTSVNNRTILVKLITESPASASQWPAKVALPPLDEGTHFSYAMQWFFFCLVALTAWIVVVRRKIQQVNASTQEQTSA